MAEDEAEFWRQYKVDFARDRLRVDSSVMSLAVLRSLYPTPSSQGSVPLELRLRHAQVWHVARREGGVALSRLQASLASVTRAPPQPDVPFTQRIRSKVRGIDH